MTPHKELAEHVNFWSALVNKIAVAVIQLEPHTKEGSHNDIDSTEDAEEEVFLELSKYCEVDRMTMESFYHPEDTGVLQEHADLLILWTQDARKALMEIQRKTRELQKEQKINEDDERAMSVILDIVEEMEEREEMKIISFEHRIRAMLSLAGSLHQQVAPAYPQETEKRVVRKSLQDTEALEHPVNTFHHKHIEHELSSAQIESHIARISSGLASLASARNSYKTGLHQLGKEIENEDNFSLPLQIRLLWTTPEDIRRATALVAKYNSKLIARGMLCDLSEDIERGHEENAMKLHNGLELPSRTIALQIKRYKLDTAALLEEL